MKKIFVLIAIGLLCSVSGLRQRITGGGLATAGQFPYVASITENGRHICGGFIYSERWIVTTATCVLGKSPFDLKVVVGQLSTISTDANEQIMDAYTITLFPQYNSTTRANDVALVRLGANIQFDYQYVDFIPYGEIPAGQAKGTFMGWGTTIEGGYESVNLRYAEVYLQPLDAQPPCKAYGDTEFDYSTMICCTAQLGALPTPGVPCQYDEGSPLVQDVVDPATSLVTPIAVGVLFTTNGCELSSQSIFTRLSVYYSWFSNTAGQQPTRP